MADDQSQKDLLNKGQGGQKLRAVLTSFSDLSADKQKEMSRPVSDPSGVDDFNKKFLDDVVSKISGGKIDLLKPSSLINQEVYQRLPANVQGQADMNAVNLLARLREIKSLYDLNRIDSYQMKNLVEYVRLAKEMLENEAGDIFII